MLSSLWRALERVKVALERLASGFEGMADEVEARLALSQEREPEGEVIENGAPKRIGRGKAAAGKE
jgi:uncharacterized protein YjiK